jgi:hypothetical protein
VDADGSRDRRQKRSEENDCGDAFEHRAEHDISISRPRKTKSGTASRIRWLIPSSMRPMRTVSGVRVVSAR